MTRSFFSCLILLVAFGVAAPAQVVFTESFNDNSAGWTLGPQWAIGPAVAGPPCDPTFGTSGDPGSDADGKVAGGIAGVVIGGCTGTTIHAPYYLESPVIDTTGSTNLRLEFDRLLKADYQSFMDSTVQVWDGTSWITIFDTPCCSFINDAGWTHVSYDITAYSSPRLRVRFGTAVLSSGVFSSPSWNLDNFRVTNGEYFFERFRDNAAGWTLGTEWQIGNATAGGSSCFSSGDPSDDADGTPAGGIAGVVLGGDATTSLHPAYYLTSPAINTSGSGLLQLEFYRVLNADYDPYMHSTVDVYNGASWVNLFDTPCCICTSDSGWTKINYNITAFSNPSLRVRFGVDVTSTGVFSIGSWNLDNISIHDPAGACTLQMSAFNGPGSFRLSAHCLSASVPPGTQLFNCITLNGAGFPWFFGINPSLSQDVLPQYSSNTLPFVGISNSEGDVTFEIPVGVPPGITVYAVTVALDPSGYPIGVSPPITYTTP